MFDWTSLQNAAEQRYPRLSGKSLGLEMFFTYSLGAINGTDSLGERLSSIQIY